MENLHGLRWPSRGQSPTILCRMKPGPDSVGTVTRNGLSAGERIAAAFEVLTVALAGSFFSQIAFSSLGYSGGDILAEARLLFFFLISEATVSLILIYLFLRLRRENLRTLGLKLEEGWPEAWTGIVSVPFLFLATHFVGLSFQSFFPEFVSTHNPILDLLRSKGDLTLFLISSFYVGGLKEEIQRAFVLVRFERFLGGIWRGLILWSLFFGIGHQTQGVDKAVGAGVLGLLFGLLYIWRRRLTGPVLAHTLFDVITLFTFWTFMRL